jgi:hypothetical protein
VEKSFVNSVMTIVAVMILVGFTCIPAAAQNRAGGAAPPPPGPVPRTADGHPDLTGVWGHADIGAPRTAADATRPGYERSKEYAQSLQQLEDSYLPAARVKMQTLSNPEDPSLRCIPFGSPRFMTLPANLLYQIVQTPTTVVILDEYFHSFRIIPTDGTPHAKPLLPTYLGDSVGRWEGDTLVVDMVGFNGEFFLADADDKPSPKSTGGWFTSDALHVIERWRRIDSESLEYQATVEDPKVLSKPWTTVKLISKRSNVKKIGEGMCFDTTTNDLAQDAKAIGKGK